MMNVSLAIENDYLCSRLYDWRIQLICIEGTTSQIAIALGGSRKKKRREKHIRITKCKWKLFESKSRAFSHKSHLFIYISIFVRLELVNQRFYWINLWIKIIRGMTSSSVESLSILLRPFTRCNTAENSFGRNHSNEISFQN